MLLLAATLGLHGRPPLLDLPKSSWVPDYSSTDPQEIGGRARLSHLANLQTEALPSGTEEIRIWMGFGLTYLQGIRLRKEKGNWQAWWLMPDLP